MLEVRNLCIQFKISGLFFPVVEKVSFRLDGGGTLGIVGESGCGKSVTALALMGLLKTSQSLVTADTLAFDGASLLSFQEPQWRRLRGNELSMIFQNPMSSLNPLMSCGRQIREAILLHRNPGRRRATAQTLSLIEEMGIPHPKRCYHNFPHELSGGMRQRIMIAMALACRPRLLIADEPTTALDVTIQAQILRLLRELRRKLGMALIFITHDPAIVKDMVDLLMVMYAGQTVEYGPAGMVLSRPRHPYTAGLIKSVPRLDSGGLKLHVIEGTVPSPEAFPRGCRFRERCGMAEESCAKLKYALMGGDSHKSACQFWNQMPA